jgi:hypothetical protein
MAPVIGRRPARRLSGVEIHVGGLRPLLNSVGRVPDAPCRGRHITIHELEKDRGWQGLDYGIDL